jgi:predicted dehydrogenase
MDRVIKIGIIGCGVMGRVYLNAAKGESSIAITAVADMNEQVAKDTADEFSVPTFYASAEALIEDPNVEAVVFAIPPAGFKTKLALQAFSLGKHGLLEKPIAIELEEVEQLIEASEGLVAASCSARLRFSDSAEAVRAILEEGTIGTLRTISCRWILAAKQKPEKLPPAWRLNPALNGGGNLTNLGTYVLDYMFGITGWKYTVQTVSGRVWGMPGMFKDYVAEGSVGETHSAAIITCRGADAPVVLLEQGEYTIGPEEAAWQISGDRGTLKFRILPSAANEVLLYQYDNDEVKPTTIWSGVETFADLQRRLLLDFANAIRDGRAPRTTLRQAYELQRTIHAVYRSSASGEAVSLQ